jgi:cytochrome c peroxidase
MKPPVYLLLIFLFFAYGCSQQQSKQADQNTLTEADERLIEVANRYFAQLPEPGDPNTPMAQLGKKLYYEEAISANGQVSCNTCHPIANYGVDNLSTSPGHDGTTGTRNSPTTLNAYFHKTQFWDGRSPDLADQAKGPVLNPIEMGLTSPEEVEKILASLPDYPAMFAAAFPEEPEPISFDNFAEAIAAFESTLATPAAFDAFLDGMAHMLNEEQKEGLSLFIETGCIACHIGPGLGGTMMQRFGLVHGPYYEFTPSTIVDRGVAEVTGKASDNYIFKTPALRNIEKTAPYFHDGSVESLEDAIRIMAYAQLGRELDEQQVHRMIEFFKSLTGDIPEHAL